MIYGYPSIIICSQTFCAVGVLCAKNFRLIQISSSTKVWARQHGKLSCTQVTSNLILPLFVNKAEYAKVKDRDLTSARKLKAEMEKSSNNLSLNCYHDASKEHRMKNVM